MANDIPDQGADMGATPEHVRLIEKQRGAGGGRKAPKSKPVGGISIAPIDHTLLGTHKGDEKSRGSGRKY